MRKIQMVDLQSQYLHIQSEVDKAIHGVVESSAFINGPDVKEFEKELAAYLDCRYVIGCGNGTDALQIALMALGMKAGDEVITSPFTFVATAEVIALLGLKPVFVDVNPNTFNLDVAQVEKAISEKTGCIIPVHLFGQAVDMESLMAVAKKYNVRIVEDNAQSIGAEYTFADGSKKKTGVMGDIGCVSFYPTKNLSCFGDGGAIFTNDEALHHQLWMIANHGSERRYYHETIGVNSRLDSMQAAVLRIKLRELDKYNTARRKAADYYDNALKGLREVVIPARAGNSSHVFHQYTLKAERRDELQAWLKEHDVPSMIYYPVPLHVQKAYQTYGYRMGDFPVAEQLSASVISLPMHSELDEEQLSYITNLIVKFYNNPK